MRKTSIFLLLFSISLYAHAQINTFPAGEGFETSFATGTNVEFLPNWVGNEVATSNRIFKTTEANSGTGALAVIPISSFSADIRVSLNLNGFQNGQLSFFAKSAKNGSVSDTRPALLFISTSIDGGSTFSTAEQIGDETTFPNLADQSYQSFNYDLPANSTNASNVVVKFVVQRGDGAGSAARFIMDDVSISADAYTDVDPPLMSNVTALSATTVNVQFNEPLDPATAENAANYALSGGATVTGTVLNGTDPSVVQLTTSTLANGQNYILTVNNVEDVNGNAIAPNSTVQFTYLVLSVAGYRDVVINEFLSNPSEETPLPNTDFVELYNPTDKYFDLTGWRVGDNVKISGEISNYILKPGGYLIVCPTDFVGEFEPFGDTRGVGSFPDFNSASADLVLLLDNFDEVIDQVNYSKDQAKGKTYEQVNPTLICSGEFNFLPSLDSQGGTPGEQNSVFQIVPDNFGPSVLDARAVTADSIRIDFDETINGALVPSALFQISPSVDVEEAVYLSAYPASVFLKLAADITPNSPYTFTVSGISDCSGNALEGNEGTFMLGATPQQGDVLLSEVLFNPRTGGSDFVEIFNPSVTTNFELRGWKLARLVNGVIDSPKPIADEGLILAPRSFLVFTANAANIALEYPKGNPDTYVQLASLPSYNDSDGIVLLLNAQDQIMQQFEYKADYHYALLKSKDGVSLERISYTAEVNDKNNWRSAASTVGFASPGRPNSQSAEIAAASGTLSVDPKVFLPGNAGTGRDFTTINYQFNSGGQFANIMIYDQQGRPVKQLANGASLATEGFFRWDGTTDRGGMARMGYYLIVFELYNGAGKTQTLKETVVVGRDF